MILVRPGQQPLAIVVDETGKMQPLYAYDDVAGCLADEWSLNLVYLGEHYDAVNYADGSPWQISAELTRRIVEQVDNSAWVHAYRNSDMNFETVRQMMLKKLCASGHHDNTEQDEPRGAVGNDEASSVSDSDEVGSATTSAFESDTEVADASMVDGTGPVADTLPYVSTVDELPVSYVANETLADGEDHGTSEVADMADWAVAN